MTVVGCTGHQTLSPDTTNSVGAAIADELGPTPAPLIGVCSLAVGADQIFAAAVLAAGGELRVILPSEGYATTFGDGDRARYAALLAAAMDTTTLRYAAPGEQAYLAAGHAVVDASDVLIAVWDGDPAAGTGGTADVVDYARARGRDVRVIWPPGATQA
jgi:hypothetical protein